MANVQPLNFSLSERTAKLGKHKDQQVIQAHATHRGSISFERFCELVAGRTTFNYMEVASILNLSCDEARTQVSNGYSVEYGRLGYLVPTLQSVQVPIGKSFEPSKHIKRVRVRLRLKRRYFDLSNMRFEHFDAQVKGQVAPGTAPVGPSTEGKDSERAHKETL